MKPGPKAELPATKMQRGTYEPGRDGHKVEMIEPDSLPAQPEWLTEAGQQVWLDEIGRVAAAGKLTELDSALFGHFCNLSGALVTAWQSGTAPPVGALVEARKMAELFGLAGRRSRMTTKAVAAAENPFLKLQRGTPR